MFVRFSPKASVVASTRKRWLDASVDRYLLDSGQPSARQRWNQMAARFFFLRPIWIAT
jgi:hypothetical protein